MLKIAPLFCAALFCAALLIVSGSANASPNEQVRLVVERGDLETRMLLTGELDAEEAVALSVPDVEMWPVSIRWIVEDAESVVAGDVLVEFDNTQLLSNYEDQLAAEDEAEAQLDDEAARLAGELAAGRYSYEKMKAETDKARLEAAVPASIQAQRDYEQKQLALQRAELQLVQQEREMATLEKTRDADLGVKQLALEKARNDARRAGDSIERLTVRAPRDGLVIVGENWREDRAFKPGDSAFPGMTVARIPDLATLYVRARLFDVDDGRLQAGQTIRARLDAFPDKVYEGRVREVGEVATQHSRRSQRRYFKVLIDLGETDPERMLPGMSVQIVAEQNLTDALLVPRVSLDFSTPQPRAKLPDGSFQDVALGLCNTTHCALLEAPGEAGLTEGTRLGRAWEEEP
jgi:HlyD family secretion protein